MTEIVLSSAEQCIFKDSLIFMFDLAYKIRYSLPLLLFASFLGFDFQIQFVTEDDQNNDNNGDENNQNIAYDLNARVIIEDSDDEEESTGDESNPEEVN